MDECPGCVVVDLLGFFPLLLPPEYCSVVIFASVFSAIITCPHLTRYLSLYPMKQCSSGFCMTVNKHIPCFCFLSLSMKRSFPEQSCSTQPATVSLVGLIYIVLVRDGMYRKYLQPAINISCSDFIFVCLCVSVPFVSSLESSFCPGIISSILAAASNPIAITFIM